MPTRDQYVQTIKSTAESLGTKLAMTYLTVKFPILVNPILRVIVEHFVDDLLEHLINKTEFGVFYLYIDFRVSKQGRTFYASAMKYVAVKNGGDPKAILEAENDVLKKFARLAVLGA